MVGELPVFDVRLEDACNFLAGLECESLDLVITDPAYESLEKHRARGTTTRLSQSDGSSNEWFEIFPNSRFEEFFALLWVAMKKDTHLYMFCDQETNYVAKPIAENVGFTFWKPLIWDKVTIGMGYHYRARYEMVLFFEKGKRKLSDLSIPDIITAKRVRGGYPTEKPVEVAATLIAQSSQPGDVVVDTFSGSGSTGVAAVQAGRNFLGVDLNQSAVDASIERIVAAGSTHLPDFRPVSAHPSLFLF